MTLLYILPHSHLHHIADEHVCLCCMHLDKLVRFAADCNSAELYFFHACNINTNLKFYKALPQKPLYCSGEIVFIVIVFVVSHARWLCCRVFLFSKNWFLYFTFIILFYSFVSTKAIRYGNSRFQD